MDNLELIEKHAIKGRMTDELSILFYQEINACKSDQKYSDYW